jgi:hypothetical protein
MYAGAQSRRNAKVRITLIHASPKEGNGPRIAGAKPCKVWFARFPDPEISNSITKG